MSNLTHSPLPWSVVQRDDGWYEIDHDANGGLDCRLSKEDAELIVKAVNCHQELLAACKEGRYWLDITSPGEDACANQLDAAIAKAEGRKA